MKLEKISEQKPLPHQEYVAQYVKAYYIPESDLENWVKYHTVSIKDAHPIYTCTLKLQDMIIFCDKIYHI